MSSADGNSKAKHDLADTDAAVLKMLGVGKQLWKRESGDDFVERLRSEDLPPSDYQP